MRPKMMPRMPRRPTAHQLSARTSLSASQRASDTVRPFEDVLAAMGHSFLDQPDHEKPPTDESIRRHDGAIPDRGTTRIAFVHSRDCPSERQTHLRGKSRHRLSEPDMPRILVETRMPKQRDGEAWKLDGRFAGDEAEGLGEIAREPRRHGGDQ